ncbi:MAG: 50S ribosomal protein L7/L12 [Myxococcota bacterium]|jgi:large subunit ribosomal protein L7/L12|nr:50S ribosomal protein L7/L12 [Myxococcota bacterium]
MSVTQDQVIEYLETLNVVQINELVKQLEERWGVKAASGGGMMMAAAPAAAAAAPAAEEPTEFKVILATVGDKKINVIKEIRAITGLGLKEAKDLVDGAPGVIKESVSKAEAADIKAKVESAGATVDVKPA